MQSIESVDTLRSINEELEYLRLDTFDIKKSLILDTEEENIRSRINESKITTLVFQS
ncbi:hypothetical protein [Microaceticoccus formicicus]|uniref:hypothetical protein n=1 Tax=Microaceticoccus formicicus TaxID=3118105 RepID=UPI003CD0391B|nr:hypothetical protein VZL98_02165 [Peptoniphilaceae bacterium AMB_02]